MEKKILKKILIFDVDGVLINSKSNMRAAWEAVKKKFNLKHDFNDYFSQIGKPFENILLKLLITKNHLKIKKIYDHVSIKNFNKIKFYNHTKKELKILKKLNFTLCIVTSKDAERTNFFLNDVTSLFTIIQCPQKNLKGKPFPDQINHVVKKLNAKKKDCIYIGDMPVDYLAAKNAKIDFVYAKWGYGDIKNVRYLKNIKDIKYLIRYNTN